MLTPLQLLSHKKDSIKLFTNEANNKGDKCSIVLCLKNLRKLKTVLHYIWSYDFIPLHILNNLKMISIIIIG